MDPRRCVSKETRPDARPVCYAAIDPIHVMHQSPPRRFGFWTLTLLVVANMIGAGVFTTSGFALADLHAPDVVMWAWCVAGIIACCGAYGYGQLARLIPESGGEYLFLARLVHPLAGFIAGWVSLIAGFTGAIALSATALESYLLPSGTPAWLPRDAVALGAVVVAALLHGATPLRGARLQNISVAIKLTLISVFVILFGWWAGSDSTTVAEQPVAQPTLHAFAISLVWISLSYSGFNAAVYVAEEAIDPKRTVPRALLCGTVLVTLLYLLLNACFVYGPPTSAVAGRENVAMEAAAWLGGPRAAGLVQALVCLALWTSILSMLMAAPRVYAKMAADGLFPSWLMFQQASPWRATVLQMVLAAVFIVVADLRQLLQYLGLTLSVSAACTVACLIFDRRQRWWGRTVVAAAYAGTTLALAIVFSWSAPRQFLAAGLTFAAGAVMFVFTRRQPTRLPHSSD